MSHRNRRIRVIFEENPSVITLPNLRRRRDRGGALTAISAIFSKLTPDAQDQLVRKFIGERV